MSQPPAAVARAPVERLSADTERKIRNINSIIYRYNKAGKAEQVAFLRGVLATLRATDGDYLPEGQTWPANQPPHKDLPAHQRPGAVPRAGAGGPPPAEHDDDYEELVERFRAAVTRIESLESDVEDLKEEIHMLKQRRFCNNVSCDGSHDEDSAAYKCDVCKRTFLSGCEGDFHCHNGDNTACPPIGESDPIVGKSLACGDCFTTHPPCCAADDHCRSCDKDESDEAGSKTTSLAPSAKTTPKVSAESETPKVSAKSETSEDKSSAPSVKSEAKPEDKPEDKPEGEGEEEGEEDE